MEFITCFFFKKYLVNTIMALHEQYGYGYIRNYQISENLLEFRFIIWYNTILFLVSLNCYCTFISEILAGLHRSLPFVLIACPLFFFSRQKQLLLTNAISCSHHLLSQTMSWLIWATVSLSTVNIFALVLGCWWMDILKSTVQILYVSWLFF